VIAHDPVTSLEAERLKTAADLTVKDVGLSGLGQIVFILQNRGAVGINTAERIADKLAGTARNVGGAGRSAKVISTPPIGRQSSIAVSRRVLASASAGW
jgi:hypothetical protein